METSFKENIEEEIQKADSDKYLSFFVAGEQYALNVLNIREVLSNQSVNHIPRMPYFMRGIINLRGHVVPVIDLKMKFGLGETTDSIDTSIVVTEVSIGQNEIIMGLLTDGVNEVLVIEEKDIEAAPVFGTEVDASFIKGIGKRDDTFIVILDINKFLSIGDLSALTTESTLES